jgi:SAM-dependent methyltransferase
MNLLPKNHSDFRETEYWDGFFKKRGRRAFEWYGEYAELCGVLHKYVKTKDDVVVVGCGNSTLSADLFDVGHRSLVSIDLSDVVVAQMNRQHARDRPELKFIKMDVTKMEFSDGAFSCVIDKGTLDAMMTDDSKEVADNVLKMFEVSAQQLKDMLGVTRPP